MTKEKDNLIKAIEEYCKKHKDRCDFIGVFTATKGKDYDMTDELIVGYGIKKVLETHMKVLQDHLDEEKEDFVNW